MFITGQGWRAKIYDIVYTTESSSFKQKVVHMRTPNEVVGSQTD